ncbi:MAG: hypothetical protein JRJ03_03170 [Deltaproteobacteria bacterium]|nr:hypothetical protein [Deltaproteobacteria bacterium]MBW2063917.1 hypothetical protein [Deltaproteobacteria bacterium]
MNRLNSILMFQQQLFNWTLVPLARTLKKKFGCKLYLQVPLKESKNDFLGRGGDEVFEEIFVHRTGYDGLFIPVSVQDRDRIVEEAKALEEKYGFRAMRDILQDDRHLGIGFMRGGPLHPRSWFSRAGNRYTALRLMKEQFDYYERLFDETQVDLILGGGGGFSGKPLGLIARRRNIPLRILCSARHKDYWYFAENEFGETPRIKDAFDKLDESVEMVQPIVPLSASKVKGRVVRNLEFLPSAKRAGKTALKQLYYKLRRYDKARSYFISDNVRLILREHSQARELQKYARTSLEYLKGTRFLFFPLQTEPEATLTTFSPEFTDQICALREIALNLPSDTLLAVKEHVYAIGRRPHGFYRHLVEIPNIAFIDPMEDGLEVVKKSIAVATISSTAGQEAAILGKPVISFGQHNIYSFLDHVHVVKGWSELPGIVDAVCRGTSQAEEERRKKQGARFLNALESISLDMEKMDMYRNGFGKRPDASEEEAELILETLLESVFR